MSILGSWVVWKNWSRGVSNHTHKHIMRPGVMKLLYFNSNFTELCSQLTKEQHPTLAQIMAWCRTGDKPLFQPMVVPLTDRYAPIGLRGVNLRAKTCDPIYVYAVHNNDWRHDETDGVSNHHWLQCLLNSWFRRRSKKTSKICVTGFVWGIHRRGPHHYCFEYWIRFLNPKSTEGTNIINILSSKKKKKIAEEFDETPGQTVHLGELVFCWLVEDMVINTVCVCVNAVMGRTCSLQRNSRLMELYNKMCKHEAYTNVFSVVNALLTSSPPVQNVGHFANDIFKCIFMDGNFCFFIRIFTEVWSQGSNWQLVKVITWHWTGDKP